MDRPRFFDSKRKKNGKMAFDGFIYTAAKEHHDYNLMYCVERKTTRKCFGSVKYFHEDDRVELVEEHNHLGNLVESQAAQLKVGLIGIFKFM